MKKRKDFKIKGEYQFENELIEMKQLGFSPDWFSRMVMGISKE